MDGLKGTFIYETICCSCYLGLRREEACGLFWEDFEWNIDNGELSYVNISRGAQYIHGREIFVEPKTLLSKRRLPLPHDLVRRIYPYRNSGRLLGKYHVHQCADYYRRYTTNNHLPYVPMSNLRTSWATYMINTGAPVSLISRYMGHADVETTVRWYTKPKEEDLIELTKLWSSPVMTKYDSDRPDLMGQSNVKKSSKNIIELSGKPVRKNNKTKVQKSKLENKPDKISKDELTSIIETVIDMLL